MLPAPESIIADALARQTCVLLVLSQRRKSAADTWTKVSIRPVLVQRRPLWQLTFHDRERVMHENLPADAAARRVAGLLHSTFEQAALYTSEADYAIRRDSTGALRATSAPPSRSAVPPADHNRPRNYLIPEGIPVPFLIEIGVMTPEGKVRQAMYHKFRQINRYLELVVDILPSLPRDRELQVVDFGCGKSYLTFALYHLLAERRGLPVRIRGLDRKSAVVSHCADLADRLNWRGLTFREGDIASHEAEGPIDLAISLHACDTATDDALAQAVRWKTSVLLAVPCCQHELAPLIQAGVMAGISRYGILHDRLSALVTDALRALWLETRGYLTQVVEFIDLEHTPKNILIRAVRRERPDEKLVAVRRQEYESLKTLLGLGPLYLEQAGGTV